MPKDSKLSAFILGALLCVGLCGLAYLGGQAALSVKAKERTVTVKGLSEREVPANWVTWPIGFQVASNNLDELFASIESNNEAIVNYLQDSGIDSDAISLAAPQVTDLYAQQWGDKSQIKYRYTANGSVTVYSDQVDVVRKAMSNVIELGKRGVVVGNTYGQQFMFTQLSELKPSMIEEATKNARAVAAKFAEDSESRLGKIKRASQGQFSIFDRDSTTPHIKKVRVVTTVEYYLSD